MPDTVTVTIGRDPSCDFVVADEYASPRHCRLTVHRDRRVFVEDLGATNGVTVVRGGQGIKVRMNLELYPDDAVVVGRTWLPVLRLLQQLAGR